MRRGRKRDVYRVLGGLLEKCPSDELFGTLAESGALAALGEAVGGKLGEAFLAMQAELAVGPEAWSAIAKDHVHLFVGPRKKLAPPWESVYRTTDRLVMQECERDVVRTYADEGVGFDGIGRTPADHISLELEFCAVMLDRAARRPASRDVLRRFLDEHLLEWVPAFATDVAKGAETSFYRSIGAALLALCAEERTEARQGAAALS